ncbi:tetratricopeptide repeat protein [Rubrivivax albus]|uniref:tetratricopeptide repeat protein n=1 Tax=Rubrivivax albus TaxID=2499835 RepID=UPI0013051818|nr:tetratricopeptide repeat protein [Rubrivivax albus]
MLRAACVSFGLLACAAPAVWAQTGPQACGNPFVNHFGPWDYRATTAEQRAIVERVHFTPGIEAMVRPGTTMMQDMAADVAYTLEVYPNHHRALLTMWRLSDRHHADPAPGGKITVECWFDRALRFRPDDTVARSMYAQFLHARKRPADAERQLDIALEHAGERPMSHYNIGLLYFELGRHDKALAQAHRAMALGLPRRELMESLVRAGQWREPEAGPGAASAAATPGG